MKILLAFTLVLTLSACSQLSVIIPDSMKNKKTSNEKSSEHKSQELYIVHIHGDWCNTCKTIDNPIHQVEPYFKAKEGVEYLVFDQTNPDTIQNSLMKAKAIGLGNLFEHERHTGEVLYVSKSSKQVLTRVYGISNVDQYKDITEKLLRGDKVPSILARKKDFDLSKPDLKEAAEADLLVIDIHHDRCGGCAITAPVFEEVAKKYRKKEEVCFMTFDLTSPQTVDESRDLARNLGIESIYNSHKHTGEVIFVDLKNKKVLGSLITETDKGKYYKSVKKYRKEIS